MNKINEFLEEIKADIKDKKLKNFQIMATSDVPSMHDSSLTIERGKDKKGKEMETCVLYLNIRDSVDLNKKHPIHTMGKIYTVCSKTMLKIAQYHSWHVRNIISDRVMILFPKDKCFTNTVNCT